MLEVAREHFVAAQQRRDAAALNASFATQRANDLRENLLPAAEAEANKTQTAFLVSEKELAVVRESYEAARTARDLLRAAEDTANRLEGALEGVLSAPTGASNSDATGMAELEAELTPLRLAASSTHAALPNETAFESLFVSSNSSKVEEMHGLHLVHMEALTKEISEAAKDSQLWNDFAARIKVTLDQKRLDRTTALKDVAASDAGENANRSWVAGAKADALRAAAEDKIAIDHLTKEYLNASKKAAEVADHLLHLTKRQQLTHEAYEARHNAYLAQKRLTYWQGVLENENRTLTEERQKHAEVTTARDADAKIVLKDKANLVKADSDRSRLQKIAMEDLALAAAENQTLEEQRKSGEAETETALKAFVAERSAELDTNASTLAESRWTEFERSAMALEVHHNMSGSTNISNMTLAQLTSRANRAREAYRLADLAVENTQETEGHRSNALAHANHATSSLAVLMAQVVAQAHDLADTEASRLADVASAQDALGSHLNSLAHWLGEDGTASTDEVEAQAELAAAREEHAHAAARLEAARGQVARAEALSAVLEKCSRLSRPPRPPQLWPTKVSSAPRPNTRKPAMTPRRPRRPWRWSARLWQARSRRAPSRSTRCQSM
jgi:hypothetical protein